MEEFGSSSNVLANIQSMEGNEEEKEEVDIENKKEKAKHNPPAGGGKLLLDEERNLGSVSGKVYARYLGAIESWWFVGLIVALLLLGQGSYVGNSLFLGYWSASSINGFSQGDYMAIYAGELGTGLYETI